MSKIVCFTVPKEMTWDRFSSTSFNIYFIKRWIRSKVITNGLFMKFVFMDTTTIRLITQMRAQMHVARLMSTNGFSILLYANSFHL